MNELAEVRKQMMVVDRIEVREDRGLARLSASLRVAGGEYPLWFEWPGGACELPGDVCLLAALQPAMATGCDLRIDAPVSTGLAARVTEIQRRMLRRPDGLGPVEVALRTADPRPAAPSPRGMLFEGGLDAFYTFKKYQADIATIVYVCGRCESCTRRIPAARLVGSLDRRDLRMKRPPVNTAAVDGPRLPPDS